MAHRSVTRQMLALELYIARTLGLRRSAYRIYPSC